MLTVPPRNRRSVALQRHTLAVVAFAAAALACTTPADAGVSPPAPQVSVFVADGELNVAPTATALLSAQVNYDAADDEWVVLTPDAIGGVGCSGIVPGGVTCAENGEDLDVDFGGGGGSITFADADVDLDFDSTISLNQGSESVVAGDGVDIVTTAASSSAESDDISTLDGDDQITTGSGSDALEGDGADLMTGGAGDDRFDSPGNGGTAAQSHDGADVFNGGGGTDTVTYAGRTFDLDADIGGGANDGQTTDDLSDCPTGAGCEGDDIRADVENLTGGSDDDRLTGSGAPNVIAGGPGDDVSSAAPAAASTAPTPLPVAVMTMRSGTRRAQMQSSPTSMGPPAMTRMATLSGPMSSTSGAGRAPTH